MLQSVFVAQLTTTSACKTVKFSVISFTCQCVCFAKWNASDEGVHANGVATHQIFDLLLFVSFFGFELLFQLFLTVSAYRLWFKAQQK